MSADQDSARLKEGEQKCGETDPNYDDEARVNGKRSPPLSVHR